MSVYTRHRLSTVGRSLDRDTVSSTSTTSTSSYARRRSTHDQSTDCKIGDYGKQDRCDKCGCYADDRYRSSDAAGERSYDRHGLSKNSTEYYRYRNSSTNEVTKKPGSISYQCTYGGSDAVLKCQRNRSFVGLDFNKGHEEGGKSAMIYLLIGGPYHCITSGGPNLVSVHLLSMHLL